MLMRRLAPRADPQQNVRLDTLVGLRWLAVIGQGAAVLFVYYVLEFELPLWACVTVIALSAWLNIAVSLHNRMSPRIGPGSGAWLLAFDIAQLALLLYLTGGLQNPFAFLFLGPVIIAAMALPPQHTVMLGAFAVACATVLLFVHLPLPWARDDPLEAPPLYMLGIWLSILLALVYIGVYAWQIAEGGRRLSDALAATELVLAREQHLSQLDGLAAAAAHELATPLSTISVVAKELERAMPAGSPHSDDVRLLREQAQRCREILSKLTELSADQPFDRAPLSAVIDEVVAPHRNFGVEIDTVLPADRSAEPVARRTPAMLYGLGNLVENAVDFARERVEIAARWSPKEITVTIADDGPGFPAEIIDRLGEPYLTTRGIRRLGAADEPTGLGLGFFIAKTLLERSGATLAFANRKAPEHGAVVSVRWQRADFDAGTAEARPASLATT
ncbi:MAG TPA: ActS/PrrB/RegB family redox-sensitive histidine kinase [Xanthobacteraceae bacterium]|nr:ActS/PrrB/RegB family redox-sensitive histidine kinase [Xanthobacteraceae bacterium]